MCSSSLNVKERARKRLRLSIWLLGLLIVYTIVFTRLSLHLESVELNRPSLKEDTHTIPRRKTAIHSTKMLPMQSQTQREEMMNTMRNFAERVLSRHIASSNVLVVSSDALRAAQSQPRKWTAGSERWSMGGTFLSHASAEGHDVHAIDFGPDRTCSVSGCDLGLDAWWSSFHPQVQSVRSGRASNWLSSSVQSIPKWIIATVFDTSGSIEETQLMDKVWEFRAESLLSEATMTYVIVTLHSWKIGDELRTAGLSAVSALLQHRYKVHSLYISHEEATDSNLAVNEYLKNLEQAQDFLRRGADAAVRSKRPSPVFTTLLFATQGLDLPMPLPETYLDSLNLASENNRTEISSKNNPKFKQCPQALLGGELEISFSLIEGASSIRIDYQGHTELLWKHTSKRDILVSNKGGEYPFTTGSSFEVGSFIENDIFLWISSKNLDHAEGACVWWHGRSRCTTRIIPQSQKDLVYKEPNKSIPNILLVLIDPISRPHFQRTMPRTSLALQELGFVQFSNYTAVGPNSGKNQAALYSGESLANRDGIENTGKDGKWLWDQLRASGFITLKAEDGCIENSNMVKSLNPQTTHGHSLSGLFCFDFDQPNCIGPDLAATRLLRYAREFVDTYEEKRVNFDAGFRWAAFIHLIDTHEDSMILSSLLDQQLAPFLESLKRSSVLDSTIILVTSDHGLHYGPYFQDPRGRLEATQPLLWIRTPSSLERTTTYDDSFRRNSAKWTTAFDVHQTLVTLTNISSMGTKAQHGLPLFIELPEWRHSCRGTTEIPPEYCERYERSLKSKFEASG